MTTVSPNPNMQRCASMSPVPQFPSLFEINTRVWLRELSALTGSHMGLADVPDGELDALAALGFDWVWLLSVWETGTAGRRTSQAPGALKEDFERVLPDLTDDDICGSGFAIKSYQVSADLGGAAGLAKFRARLAARGVRLMLDFVPNHTAIDHRWVEERPEFYVSGTLDDLKSRPDCYTQVETHHGRLTLAHGRDPNFPGWPDTLQLNYGNADLQAEMVAELERVAEMCDGVRCDMAMLVLPGVFNSTWGLDANPFWPAAVEATRRVHPEFTFVAEVYWDLEWELQQQGFDYCYDKRLFDRLRYDDASSVRSHLAADIDYQSRLVRFLENHDEDRAASSFPAEMHMAAAVITYLAPGLRLFHQGQLTGSRTRLPTHLCRGPVETVDSRLSQFYLDLLSALSHEIFQVGDWAQLSPDPAWDTNASHRNFVTAMWTDSSGRQILTVVNYSPDTSQCRLKIDLPFTKGAVLLTDLLGGESYRRERREIEAAGLFIELAPWCFSIFDISASSS